MKMLFKKTGLVIALLALISVHADAAGLAWPKDHLLPTFPAPASVIDCIESQAASGAELDLFASLEGIINRHQPRLAVIGQRDADGSLSWLKIHHLTANAIDGFDAVEKYKGELNGLIVIDPDRPETLNLATTLAGLDNALICDPALLSRLTNAPINLKIVEDLRGRFATRDDAYDYFLKSIWPRCSHRIIAGLSPNVHGNLRDFLVAVNAAVFWLDPRNSDDAAIFAKFAPDLKPAHALYMGWWPDEDAGLKWIGPYGVPVLASDFFLNGSLFAGVAEPVQAPPIPPMPPLQNKIYLSFFISDGDNVQYMQHKLRKLWEDPARGKIPIGWTVSPLTVDLDPGMLNYYYRTATTNDCLVSGPSGAVYERLDFWKPADLDAFTKITSPYLERSGIKIITVWLHVTDDIGHSFAANCPTLLGLTSQEGGNRQKMFGKLPLIDFIDRGAYDGELDQLRTAIDKASRDWDGKSPRFLAVQANAWKLGPSDFLSLANSLDANKFVFVRPDHLFELFKLSHNSGN